MKYIGWLTGFGHDLKYAARGLARSRMFTLVCSSSVALGIFVIAMLIIFFRFTFAPHAAVEADGAVELLVTTRGQHLDNLWSYPDFADVRRADLGMDVSAWAVGTRNLGGRGGDGDAAETVGAMYVSPNYFRTLGVDLARGRAFLQAREEVIGPPPVIINHDTWTNRFGADPEIVGRSLRLNGIFYRVVGVATPGFRGQHAGHNTRVWLPLWEHPVLGEGSTRRHDRAADWLHVAGRLHDGTTLAEANGALSAVMSGLAEAHPASNEFRGADVVAYSWQGGAAEERLLRLLLHVPLGIILLVVSLNLTGMVMVRSASREHELAVRQAVGSGRWRLVRYLMTESGLLAVLGAGVGLTASLLALQYLLSGGRPPPDHLYAIIISACLGLAIVAMLIIGLAPALKFSRPQLLRSLKDDAGGGDRRSSRVHRFATSAQAALALPVLVVIGMVLQASSIVDQGDYGFQPENMYLSTINLTAEEYTRDEVDAFLRRLRARVASLAGVESVSIANGAPLDYDDDRRRVAPAGEPAHGTYAETTRVGDGFFETIGTPILRGRGFGTADAVGSEPVAVITRSLAEQLWPDQPAQAALGRQITFALDRTSDTEMMIVGIAGDVVGRSHNSNTKNLFVPLRQHPTKRITLVVGATSESSAIATAIEDVVVQLDPGLSRPDAVTSGTLMERAARGNFGISLFLGGLSLLLLFLAALGVYGVVTFSVVNRTREFGVRMAMGAPRPRIMAMVLSDGVKLALPGILVGSVLAVLLARAFLGRWYAYLHRTTLDWGVLSIAAGIALTVVLLASSAGARRAASVEPMKALRWD